MESQPVASSPRRSWNKGKTGQKVSLKLKEIWSIGTCLQIANMPRERVLFNLAIVTQGLARSVSIPILLDALNSLFSIPAFFAQQAKERALAQVRP